MSMYKVGLERFALSFSTGLFLSVVLSVGGYCQTVFVNGLLGDATSIYDALIPQGFSTSIPFLDWLKSFYIYWYMPLSILACYIALAYKNIRSIFLALSIGIFFELIIIDFWILYTSDQLDSFPINLLSNFFGCPLVAMLICLLLMSKASFSRYITRNKLLGNLIYPITLSLLVVFLLFVLIKNLFWVTPSKISALVNADLRGEYTHHLEKKETSGKLTDKNKFGIFSTENSNIEEVEWHGIFKNTTLEILHPTQQAVVKVYFFDSCGNKSTKDIVKNIYRPNFAVKSAKDFKLTVNSGSGHLSMYSENRSNGEWFVEQLKRNMFYVKPGSKKNTSDIFIVSPEGSDLHHEGWHNEMYYRYESWLVGGKEAESQAFAMYSGKESANYEFSFDRNSALKLVECKQVTTTDALALLKTPILTTIVHISYPPIKTYQDAEKKPKTIIRGLVGWLGVKDVPAAELSHYINDGEVEMISIVADFKELYIDSNKQEKRMMNQWLYLSEGVISGSATGELLKFDAEVSAVVLDGDRVSKTRWEKIESKFEWLIAITFTLLGFSLKSFWNIWKSDKEIIRFF